MIASLLARREALLVLACLLLLGAITSRFPAFASPSNLVSVFNDTSILIILALGQAAVILSRSIDLSVAANLAFTGMCVAMLNHAHPELPLALRVLDTPLIVLALGTLTGYRGLGFVLSGGAWVNAHEM